VDAINAEVSWLLKDLTSKRFQLQYPPDHYVLQYPENGEYLSNQVSACSPVSDSPLSISHPLCALEPEYVSS